MFLNMICPGTCSNYQKSMKMLTMMMLLPKDALMTVGANVEALISVQTSFCQLSPAGWWWAVVPLCNYIFPLSCFTLSLLFHLPLFIHSYCYFSIQASQTKLKNTTKTRPDLLFLTLPRTPTRVKDIPWFFWSLLSEISLSLSAYSPVALYLAGSLYPPYPPCLPCSPYLRCLPQPVPVSFMSYKSTTSNCPPCPSFPPSPHFPTSDMIFVQLFTTPDFQAKIFTL